MTLKSSKRELSKLAPSRRYIRNLVGMQMHPRPRIVRTPQLKLRYCRARARELFNII